MTAFPADSRNAGWTPPCPPGGDRAEPVTHEAVTVSLGEAAVQPAKWREVTQQPCVAGTTLKSDSILAGCRPKVHVRTQLRCCDPQGAMSCGSPMPRGERIAKPAEWGHPHGRFLFFGASDGTESSGRQTHPLTPWTAADEAPGVTIRRPTLRGIMGHSILKHWMRYGLVLVAGLAVATGCGKDGGTGPAPDYTLSLAPAALTIVQGATGPTTVTSTRSNFTGVVTLSLGGAPAGLTGSVNPSAPSGTSAPLTGSGRAAAAPGVYTPTAAGTATAGNHSTPLTPTLPGAPAYTPSRT